MIFTGIACRSDNEADNYLINRARSDSEHHRVMSTATPRDPDAKTRYIVDTTHSSVQFRVRHWGIYDIIGRLESYEMEVFYEQEDFLDMEVVGQFRPAGITMPNKDMAAHLQREGFFHTEAYPVFSFRSTSMEQVADSTYRLTGEMTIKDISREVVFDVQFNGFTHPPSRSTPGFTIHGQIDRLAFDLGGEELLPGNGLPLIGHTIYLTSNVRLISEYD